MKQRLYVVEVSRIQGTPARFLDDLGFRVMPQQAHFFRSKAAARVALSLHRHRAGFEVPAQVKLAGTVAL